MKKLLALLGTGGLTVATSSSLIACQLDTPKVYTNTIILSTDTVQVEVDSTFRIQVFGGDEFGSFGYWYKIVFEETATINKDGDWIEVTGVSVGTGTFFVTRKGAENVNVSVEVVPKTIHLSTKEINVTNTFESFVQIGNYSTDGGFDVISNDESIAKAKIDETNEEILIQGVGVGSTTLTVSATGIPSSTINVTVDENTKEIKLTPQPEEGSVIKITKGTSDTSITVELADINSSDVFTLDNVKIVSKDQTIARGSVDTETGVLNIRALSGGEVSLYVNAIGAKPIEILIEVNEDIVANNGIESIEIVFPYAKWIVISNYNSLGKITCEFEKGGDKYVSMSRDEEWILLEALQIGKTTLTISARYMTKPLKITVKVVKEYSE